MSTGKIDDLELLRRILAFDEDMLRDDYPRELVRAELREAGLDPDEVGRRGEAFVKKLLAEKADSEGRKASRTRLRSPPRATSVTPPGKMASSLPPVRAKVPSDTGPSNEE